jgi:uncharacterized protein YndB with AHSA1/START domain
MPLTCEIKERFPAPPERVFQALVDLEQVGQWMPGFVRMEPLTPGPLGKGSQFRETRRMFGREASEVFEVTEYDPPRVLAFFVDGRKGSSRVGWYRFRYVLAPSDGGSDLTFSGEFGGTTGCLAFLGRLMMGPMKKAIAKDLAAMRGYLEMKPR